MNAVRKFIADEGGVTAVEYAVMLALIVVACLTSISSLATSTGNSFDESASRIAAAIGSSSP